MAGVLFSLAVAALVICNPATRARVDAAREFDDLPRPNHIGA